MYSYQLSKTWHQFTILVLLVLLQVAQYWAPEWVMQTFRFDRQMPLELWRYISCHFIHLGFNHFVMNLVGSILLLLCFFKESEPARDLAAMAWLLVGTSIGLYCFSDLYRYVGFSAVLHGYWIFLLLVNLKHTPRLNALFALFVLLKVVGEQLGYYSQTSTAAFIGGPIATFSHLCGVISGLVAVMVYFFFIHLKEK